MSGTQEKKTSECVPAAKVFTGIKRKKTTRAQFKKLAFEVFERDGFQCQYCGKIHTLEDMGLHAHHIKFKSQGGQDVQENLVSLCGVPCHRLLHDGFIPREFKKVGAKR